MSKNIRGLSELMQKLSSLGVDSQEVLNDEVKKQTLIVEGNAKEMCPVDTGDLRNSIRSRMETGLVTAKGIVSTNSDHAAYVEFGTGQRGIGSPSPPKADIPLGYREDWKGMEAQPYLYPALANRRVKIKAAVTDALRKKIREVSGR